MKRQLFEFEAGAHRLLLGHETKLMGVLNVTPDSFSDGGNFMDPGRAQAWALRQQIEGAHVLDVGGESSRPGARFVSWREEWRRVKPVLKRLTAKLQIPISIDTVKWEVAERALGEGASIVNDIQGLRSKKLAKCIARNDASVIVMHMQGNPKTMQKNPQYKIVWKEVRQALKQSIDAARNAGIPKTKIMIDPGFGFGKTSEHNLLLLSHLDQLASLGYPVLVGLSRKSFLGNLLGLPVGERLGVSLAAAGYAIERGAHMLRVHDVQEHRQVAAVVDRLMGI